MRLVRNDYLYSSNIYMFRFTKSCNLKSCNLFVLINRYLVELTNICLTVRYI